MKDVYLPFLLEKLLNLNTKWCMIGYSITNCKQCAFIIYDNKKVVNMFVLLQNSAVILVDVDLLFLFKPSWI